MAIEDDILAILKKELFHKTRFDAINLGVNGTPQSTIAKNIQENTFREYIEQDIANAKGVYCAQHQIHILKLKCKTDVIKKSYTNFVKSHYGQSFQ